jgi:hypothetical protein
MPKQASETNNLQTTYPEIAKRWHSSLNGAKKPSDFRYGSGKKAWWLCDICSEAYEATILSQTSGGHRCPYCSGRNFRPGQSLADLFPHFVLEWHPTKNACKPNEISPYNDRRIWWQCLKGHEWPTSVRNRTRLRSSCPHCVPQTSKTELRFFAEMKYIFPTAVQRERIHGLECDIFIEKYQLGIEVDGGYYHRKKLEKDKKKQNRLRHLGINIFNIRGAGLQKLNPEDVFFDETGTMRAQTINLHKCVKELVSNILQVVELREPEKSKAKKYLQSPNLMNEAFADQLIQNFSTPDQSLDKTHLELCQEWDFEKNGSKMPQAFTFGSGEEVWWKCQQNHSWLASILSRTKANKGKGSGCPFCRGYYPDERNNLAIQNPQLASELHPSKNRDITAFTLTPRSSKKVWWLCEICGNEWKTAVCIRNKKHGCPKCAKRINAESLRLNAVRKKGSLEDKHPLIAKEWHLAKNNDKEPCSVSPGSGYKAWWVCCKGHEWQAVVKDRCLDNNGCKTCKGKQASAENNLALSHPEIINEWDFNRNAPLTPFEVLPGSDIEVFWICSKTSSHPSFKSKIYDKTRSKKGGCPYCSRKKVLTEDSLQMKHPDIAADWDFSKNERNPINELPGSAKKVWWMCKNGHEKYSEIRGRVSSKGCPLCKRW